MDQQDKKLWDLLDASRRPRAPEGFAESVMRLIAQEQQTSEVAAVSWFARILHSKPACLAAASACAAAVAFMLAINTGGNNTPAGTSQIVINEIDDQILLDFACNSLGNEDLQDAVYQISSVDALTEQDLAEIMFNF